MKKLREIFGGISTKKETNKSDCCCGSSETTNHKENSLKSKGVYYCPMKCEGEKTYQAPGICPVCNMHLVLIDH